MVPIDVCGVLQGFPLPLLSFLPSRTRNVQCIGSVHVWAHMIYGGILNWGDGITWFFHDCAFGGISDENTLQFSEHVGRGSFGNFMSQCPTERWWSFRTLETTANRKHHCAMTSWSDCNHIIDHNSTLVHISYNYIWCWSFFSQTPATTWVPLLLHPDILGWDGQISCGKFIRNLICFYLEKDPNLSKYPK